MMKMFSQRSLKAGLLAGSLASIIAALLSVPLKSPDDTLFNSLTVVIGVLAAGLLAGAFWSALFTKRRGRLLYAISLSGAFLAVAAIAGVSETQALEHIALFTVTLAAVAFAVVGFLTPVLVESRAQRWWWSTPVAVIVALALGTGLAGQGDEESGALSLPPRATPTATARATSPSPMLTGESAEAVASPAPQQETAGPTPTIEPTVMAGPAATPTAEPTATQPALPTETAVAKECPFLEGDCWIIGAGSEATFTVEERLARLPLPNDAVVRTSQITGEINLGRPSLIHIDLHSLSSDQSFRDRYIRSSMFPSSPVATFTVDDIGQVPEGFLDGDTVTAQVAGSLSIKGGDFPLSFDLEIRDDGDVLNILGRTTFTWDQLEIRVPSARSVLWVADEVQVEVLIQARPKPE